MAFFRGSIRAQSLDMDTTLNVCIPFDRYDPPTGACLAQYDKTLILLHGLRQNADSWPRMSGVEQAASQYGYCVVMPEVQRSFYTDMAFGMPYFTYITQELPDILRKVFRLPMDKEHLYIGGLSMGGFGALKCALTYPDRYAGAMCFSSGFYMLDHVEFLFDTAAYRPHELQGILGVPLQRGEDNDLDRLAHEAAAAPIAPRIYLACGTEDYLYRQNLQMRDSLASAGLAFRYEEWPGMHDWAFWDEALRRGMANMVRE